MPLSVIALVLGSAAFTAALAYVIYRSDQS